MNFMSRLFLEAKIKFPVLIRDSLLKYRVGTRINMRLTFPYNGVTDYSVIKRTVRRG